MKKVILALAVAAMAAAPAGAELIFSDSFAYSAGNLASQGPWVYSGTAGSYAIEVTEGSLVREGYQAEAAGNSAYVSMQTGKNALQAIFAPVSGEAAGAVYYSALVRVDDFPASLGKPGAIMSLTGVHSYTGEMGDNITGSEGGGLFVKKGATDGTAVFGISRKSSPMGIPAGDVEWVESKEIALGETALIVVYYAKNEGDSNDEVMLWVNPEQELGAADATIAGQSIDETLVDVRGIQLCQRSAITSKIPACTIDEVRVATDAASLFGAGGPAVTVPNVTLSENPVNFGQVYCNISYEKTVTVKATDLTGDITLTPGESGQVTLSQTVIAKEAAMSEEGVEVTITLLPVESRFFSDKIQISTEGAGDKVLQVDWQPVPTLASSTLSTFCNEDENDMTSVYVYTGEAIVTFVESYYDLSYDRVVNSIFAQDATGGVELRSALGCGYDEVDISGVKAGDKITNIAGYLIFGDAGLTMVPRTAAAFEVIPGEFEATPIELTLRDLAMADNGYIYGNQLVRVKHVTFPDEYYEAGDYHGLWNAAKYEIYDGTLDDHPGVAWMWNNKGADYFKTSTAGYFDHRWTLTGIVNSYYPIHISPRGKSDFEDEGLKHSSLTEVEVAEEGDSAYDLLGRPVDAATARGVVIVRKADGSVRKILRD